MLGHARQPNAKLDPTGLQEEAVCFGGMLQASISSVSDSGVIHDTMAVDMVLHGR